MIRAFVAVDLPDETKEKLSRAIEILRPINRGVRWVRPDGMHLTLKFLGDIPEEIVRPMSSDLDAAASTIPPLNLALAGLGAFPDTLRPRVVWVGLTGDIQGIKDLALYVDRACASHGIPMERRPFSPHITLGRLRMPSMLDLRVEPVNGGFEASEIVLYKSELSRGGARYTALHRSGLKGRGVADGRG
jgi:2'-5' RNA ligase